MSVFTRGNKIEIIWCESNVLLLMIVFDLEYQENNDLTFCLTRFLKILLYSLLKKYHNYISYHYSKSITIIIYQNLA